MKIERAMAVTSAIVGALAITAVPGTAYAQRRGNGGGVGTVGAGMVVEDIMRASTPVQR